MLIEHIPRWILMFGIGLILGCVVPWLMERRARRRKARQYRSKPPDND